VRQVGHLPEVTILKSVDCRNLVCLWHVCN